MAISFSVTTDTGTTTFSAITGDPLRGALDMENSAPEYNNRVFNIPGVDGNYISRQGQRGGRLTLTVRYYGTAGTSFAACKTDREDFAKQSCSITDGTETYTRCTLISGQRMGPEQTANVNGTYNTFFDYRYDFRVDEI